MMTESDLVFAYELFAILAACVAFLVWWIWLK
jgi:hypothetical protein